MQNNPVTAVLIVWAACLSGCAATSGQGAAVSPAPASAPAGVHREPAVNAGKNQDASSHLTQCNRDLESLRTVSMTEYRRYTAEYDALMKSSAGFMTVKDDVSPEVAELARPKFQFALVNLCYRIKDALAQTLINQAGGR